jgi:hypothetical protein
MLAWFAKFIRQVNSNVAVYMAGNRADLFGRNLALLNDVGGLLLYLRK